MRYIHKPMTHPLEAFNTYECECGTIVTNQAAHDEFHDLIDALLNPKDKNEAPAPAEGVISSHVTEPVVPSPTTAKVRAAKQASSSPSA